MEISLQIGGKAVKTEQSAEVRLPYDGSLVATVSQAGPREVEQAIEAARTALGAMRTLSRYERAEILRRARAGLLARREEMGRAVAEETGKPIREALGEVDRAGMTLLFSAEEAGRLSGEEVPVDAHPGGRGRRGMTVREPVGVIAAITPFNFPLNLAMHKIGPALAAGNTVVHKMASATPLSGLRMAAIFAEAGLPAGALNVLAGPGGTIGDLLVGDSRVAMVTFTGSVEVGLRIRNLAGRKRVTLELGSNSAVIVDESADLERAVAKCVAGSYANSGQVCISVQRIFAHRAVREEFVERFAEATGKMKLGHPLDPATEVSSLITEREAVRVEGWIAEARGAGARLVRGGERQGPVMTPAVLAEVPESARLMRSEAFGPVVSINETADLDEAIARVNASDYGLQAGIFTRDLERAFEAAGRVRVGGFHINEAPQFRVDQMPYGGVKQSGLGREGPRYAIEEMTELKLITW